MVKIPSQLTLPGKSIELRTPEVSDYPAMDAILNDRETMEALIPYFEQATWSDEDLRARRARFKTYRDENVGIDFVVSRRGDPRIVGKCALKDIEWDLGRAEFGVILHRSVWGQGVSVETHLLALEYGFEGLGLNFVFFQTLVSNKRMVGFFKGLDITQVATDEDGSLYFEVSAEEWPALKRRLQAKLERRLTSAHPVL